MATQYVRRINVEERLKAVGNSFLAASATTTLKRIKTGNKVLDDDIEILDAIREFIGRACSGSLRTPPPGKQSILPRIALRSENTTAYSYFLQPFLFTDLKEKFPKDDAEFFERIIRYQSVIDNLKTKKSLRSLPQKDREAFEEMFSFWNHLNGTFLSELRKTKER